MPEPTSEQPAKLDAEHADVLEPELIFGLVGPLGSNVDAAQEALTSELMKVGYTAILVHLTKDIRSIIPQIKKREVDTYEQKIDLMNQIVSHSGKSDFLARVAIATIASRRVSINQLRGLTPRQGFVAQIQ